MNWRLRNILCAYKALSDVIICFAWSTYELKCFHRGTFLISCYYGYVFQMFLYAKDKLRL